MLWLDAVKQRADADKVLSHTVASPGVSELKQNIIQHILWINYCLYIVTCCSNVFFRYWKLIHSWGILTHDCLWSTRDISILIKQKIVKLHYNIIIFLKNTLIRHTVISWWGNFEFTSWWVSYICQCCIINNFCYNRKCYMEVWPYL